MNFFDAQDKARRATRWLVVVYVVATGLIVAGVTLVVGAAFYGLGPERQAADTSVLAGAAIAATVLIVGATLYRVARLSSGGGRVATEMGGVKVSADVSDPLRRRLRNVVEEMAIASGVPVPEIYVLEKEPGINAFAAGYTPGDAAVAVTRGTLELLDREELQGVIAHEFSHILNGDMRLNIRMMGVLFGIMVLSLVGRMILRGGYHSGGSNRRGRSVGGVVLLGIGLTVLGYIGIFFARLIKSAVSRQREFLADASAVQFTRQTTGISNALKKIGGYQAHSYIQVADAEEISHMLFAHGAKFSSLFATHPPLNERIRKLDPGFDEGNYPDVTMRSRGLPRENAADPRAAGFSPSAAPVALRPADIIDSIGQPGPAHVTLAAALRRSIPEELLTAAHSPSRAYLVALALLLDPDAGESVSQLRFLEQQLGAERAGLVQDYHRRLAELGPLYRLPMLEIAFPALKLSPSEQLQYLLDMARRVIELDGRVDLREFCFYRILSRTLAQAADPSAPSRTVRASRTEVRQAAIGLLTMLAEHGHDSGSEKRAAFAAGAKHFGRWASDDDFGAHATDDVARFDGYLDVLNRMNGKAKQTLLKAVTATVTHDGQINLAEAEMVRAVCASIDCPLPPMLENNPREQTSKINTER